MTGQNRSSAVMQPRIEPADSLDDFPTPPWATRAVIEMLVRLGFSDLAISDVREPCANRGHMVKPLREAFGRVLASDIFDYGHDFAVLDYLFGPDDWLELTDWTFINPPFRLAQEFIERALRLSRIGVVVIARSAFSEGQERGETLFIPRPPSFEYQFCERVVMLKGRLVRDGSPDPFNLDGSGKPKKASTATSYSAFVWLKRDAAPADTRKRWIAPRRLRLERAGDYPVYPMPVAEDESERLL